MSETSPQETRTYRGGSLEELLPRILDELGPEAVITKQREGVLGGVGGFFGKRCVEVEVEVPLGFVAPASTPAPTPAAPPRSSLPHRALIDAYDIGDTLTGIPGLAAEPARAAASQPAAAAPASPPTPAAARPPRYPGDTGSPIIDSVFAQALPFADHLTAASATSVPSTTLAPPPSWAGDLDLSQLEGEEYQPLEQLDDTLAEEARAWAKQEIRELKRAVAERHKDDPAPARPAAAAPAPAPQVAAPAPVAARPAPAAARPVAIPAPTHRAAPAALAPAAPAAAPVSDNLPAKRWPAELVALAETLSDAGLSESLVLQIHKDIARDGRPFSADISTRDQARAALAKRIKVKNTWRGKRHVIALVGGPGSGKTVTAAKLCHAFAVEGGLSVGAMSLESPRVALQLGYLTDGIGVDLQIADLPSQVPMAAGRLVADDLIVVDTPSVYPNDPESMTRLESLLLALRPDETHFLVPASAEIEPSQELLDALAARIGVDRILITRLDEATSLGAQVALSISSRLPISYLASGDTVGFGLAPADPVALASMVLP